MDGNQALQAALLYVWRNVLENRAGFINFFYCGFYGQWLYRRNIRTV